MKNLLIALLFILFVGCTKDEVPPLDSCNSCVTNFKCGYIFQIENLWTDCNKISITTTNVLGEEIIIISDCINDLDILDYNIDDWFCKD
jgi:hypothetical protein